MLISCVGLSNVAWLGIVVWHVLVVHVEKNFHVLRMHVYTKKYYSGIKLYDNKM